MKRRILMGLLLSVSAATAWAGDQTRAVVGGGVGGAVGAAIGDELGDREGAIVGSAIGAAVGTAIATDEKREGRYDGPVRVEAGAVSGGHPAGRHCPPGQAKKGRC